MLQRLARKSLTPPILQKHLWASHLMKKVRFEVIMRSEFFFIQFVLDVCTVPGSTYNSRLHTLIESENIVV